MHLSSFSKSIFGAVVAALLAAPAAAGPFTVGGVTFDTDNTVQEATLSTTGTISPFSFNAPIQGAGNPDVDPDHHIGALLGNAPNSAMDLTGAHPNSTTGRTTIELNWGTDMAAENVAGDDLYILESGAPNFPEAYAIRVRELGGAFSAPRYEFFTESDPATLKLLTAYDFSDFGLAPGAVVDAVQVISLHNASATTAPNLEDRAIDASGGGELILDAGSGTGFAIDQGPLSDAPGTYPDSAMDADIVYVVAASVVSTAAAVKVWTTYE